RGGRTWQPPWLGRPASRRGARGSWKKLRWLVAPPAQAPAEQGDAFAVAARGVAEVAWRHSRHAMEAAREIRQIGEAGVERDGGDRTSVIGEHARGMAQARAQQVLVRRHPDHAREQAQEVPRTQAGLFRRRLQVDVLV